MTQKTINPGLPPLVWSKVQQEFEKINDNFTELYSTIEGEGGAVVDFTTLGTSLIPRNSEVYDLGSPSKRWKDLYLSGNSLYVGNALITSTGSTINLPAGSTIDGLRVDENYFKYIAVSGETTIEADDGTDTLNFAAGDGVEITTDNTTDTLSIANTGVLRNIAGTGISISNGGTGNVTVTNAGVTSVTAGNGISVNAGVGAVTLTNSGVTRLEAGNGMIVDVSTGVVTVTNGSPASTIRSFEYVSVSGQPSIRADNNSDTLNIARTGAITLATDASSDTVTIGFDNRVDIVGSVFSDNSTMLVDGTNGRIVGPVFADVTGNVTGNLTGNVTGNVTGFHDGDMSGTVFADNSTMLVDGTNGVLTADIVKVGNVGINANGAQFEFQESGVFIGPSVMGIGSDQYFSHIVLRDDSTALSINKSNGPIRVNANGQIWDFNLNGTLATPGFTFPATDGNANDIMVTNGSGTISWTSRNYLSYVSKTGGSSGVISTISLNPTANVNWDAGVYVLDLTGGTTNASVQFTVDGSGNISSSIISGGAGFSVSQNITVPGTSLGGLTPTHDLTVTVTAITQTFTALDLTKTIQKLTSGNFSLADGTEGQIMHFVPQTGADVDLILIRLSDGRKIDGTTGSVSVSTTADWTPFDKTRYNTAGLMVPAMATVVFTDGAWTPNTGYIS